MTHRCNLTCDYCYEGKNKTNTFFSKESIPSLIEFIKENNVRENVNINFHGGEPFLEFDNMKAIAEEIANEFDDYEIGLTTNGTLINDEAIDFIKKYICEITVSIDGDQKTHDRYRCFANGKGSFDLVLNNINKLKSAGVENIRYRMTFNHETVVNLYNNIINLANLGIDNVVAFPDSFDKLWDEKSIDIYREELRKLKQLKDSETVQFYVPLVDKNEYKPRFRCSGGIGSYNVDCDGAVYPCTYTVGNKKYQIGTLDSGVNRQIVEDIECNIYKKEVELCSDCKARLYCSSYRCKYVNELLTNQLFTPSPIVCALNRTALENAYGD